jgi:hypothetical protein
MEDKYQKIIDDENKRLNERIAKIEHEHKRIIRKIYIAALIIIAVTIYFCLIVK